MGKVLFIVNDYYPLKNASGSCIDNIIKIMIADGHEVHVLCYMDQDIQLKNNNVNIHGIKVNDFISTSNFSKTNKDTKLRRFIYLVKLFFTYPIYYPEIGEKLTLATTNIISHNSVDIIVYVVNPIESLIPLIKIDRKKIKHVIYELDSITDLDDRNRGLRIYLNKRRKLFEKKAYSKADAIIHMKCHSEHFNSEEYKSIKSKMFLADFPLYQTALPKDLYIQFNNPIKMLFSGSLYKGIRDPIKAVDILKDVSKSTPISIDFFSRGDYETFLNKVSIYNNFIKCNGYVDSTTLQEAYDNTDILLSIGNYMHNMVPSKIYSYISMRKPIIHFYIIDNDPCIELLSDNPLALLINVNDNQKECSNSIIKFINRINNNSFLIDDANRYYLNDPQFTADIIVKKI